MGTVGGAGSWASLFKGDSAAVDTLLDPLVTTTMNRISNIPDDIVEDGIQEWKNYLVGFFVGKGLPFNLVHKALELIWKDKSSFSVSSDRDFFYVKFDEAVDKTQIMEAGPIYIAGMLFIRRPWSYLLVEQRRKIETLPIWVKFWELPKELWTKKGLSFIASLLGTPICADEKTMKRERLDFARVCVEVSASFKFNSSFKLKMKGGRIAVVQLEYPWKPVACSKCERFGHKFSECEARINRVWKSIPTDSGGILAQREEGLEGAATKGDRKENSSDREGEAKLGLQNDVTMEVVATVANAGNNTSSAGVISQKELGALETSNKYGLLMEEEVRTATPELSVIAAGHKIDQVQDPGGTSLTSDEEWARLARSQAEGDAGIQRVMERAQSQGPILGSASKPQTHKPARIRTKY